MKLLEAVFDRIVDKSAPVALEHLEKRADGRDQGLVAYDSLVEHFTAPSAEKMRRPIHHYVMEFLHGLYYEDEEAFCRDTMMFVNRIRADQLS